MGSAITFSDKITNKNCQNLQEDPGESRQSQEEKNENSRCSTTNPCFCFQHHVDVDYCCDCDNLENGIPPFVQFQDQDHDDEEEAEEDDNQGSKSEQEGIESESLFSKLTEYIMRRKCLCDTIKPILRLSQLLGVIPLNVEHERNSQGMKTGVCELTFRWRSLSTFFNTTFILFFLVISPFAHSEIRDRMIIVFSGTDLYAFSLQTVTMVIETTILLSVGRLYQGKFSQGWSSLNNIFHELCDSADDLRKIKFASYITAFFICVESIFFFVFMYLTSNSAIGMYQSCPALLIGTFVISLTLIIPYIMSTLFLFICLLIRSHFLKISELLDTVVHKQRNSPKLSTKIDSLRVLHEQLCQTVTYFEDFFGFQVLLTLCTCCFTVTVGAYACILKGENISSQQGKELTGAWNVQLYCAAIFIFLILISGQLVTNAASSPGPVLNAVPLTELDEKSQIQVTAFLNKISAFPTKMSAVKITTISTTFLASAATNITTYLLVLMQFKLSIENRYDEEEADNLTTAIPGFDLDGDLRPIFYNVTTPESLAFLTEST